MKAIINDDHRELAEAVTSKVAFDIPGCLHIIVFAEAVAQAIADAEQRGRFYGIRESVHAVSMIQYQNTEEMFQQKLRDIWWECREAVIALLPEKKQP